MSHPHELKRRDHWNPVQAAAYDLVHGYVAEDGTKGPTALAPRFEKKKSATVLSNEVNPDYQTAKFGLDDAIRAEQIAGRTDILHAHARMLGYVCYAVPNPDTLVADVELLTKFAEWQSAMGKTCEEIRRALDPTGPNGSGIACAESSAICEAGYAHMTRFMEFLDRLRFIAEPCPIPTQGE